MIAVIGDIHGCLNTLKELVEKINKKYPGIAVYSTGDLVDRGRFSFETVQFVIDNNIVFTPGNHDYMFYYYFNYPSSEMAKTWLFNGSTPTLDSYSRHRDKITEHLNYIISFKLFVELDHCFISHAGISDYYKKFLGPEPLYDKTKLESLVYGSLEDMHGIIWNRDNLLDLGKLQIVGHTRQRNVEYNKKKNCVYVDTSVYTGNMLSCVIVDEGKIIDTLTVKTHVIDIK